MRIKPALPEHVTQGGSQPALIKRQNRKRRLTQQPGAKRRRRGRVRLHGVTGHNRSALPHGPTGPDRGNSPVRPSIRCP